MRKVLLSVAVLILMGNISFAAGEKNVRVETEKKMEVSEKEVQDISEKVGSSEIVREERGKKSKKNKINSFISKIAGKNWKMVWNDEFNGNQLDTTKWTYWENGNPWHAGNYLDENGNLVKQYGFDAKHFYLRDNVRVENGNMIITLKKETDKKVNINGVERRILYSSGAIHTRNLYNVQYGKIEMRAAMPEGIGTWPAFWLWPEGYSFMDGKPAVGEIDIVETYGDEMDRATGTLHVLKSDNTYETFDGDDYKLSKWLKEKLTNFNTYAVEWDEKEIKWLFNNKVYKKFSYKELDKKGLQNPFKQPYFIMINVALSKKTGEETRKDDMRSS